MFDYYSVHRDLKPHNILLLREDSGRLCVKISDFGLSKKYRPGQTTSRTAPTGTRGWAAPELHDKRLREEVAIILQKWNRGGVICPLPFKFEV